MVPDNLAVPEVGEENHFVGVEADLEMPAGNLEEH